MLQVLAGRAVYKGRIKWLPYHRRNPVLIIAVGLVHVYLAVGVWFLGFSYGR